MSEDKIKLKPCPFCDGTDIRLSIKRAKYPYWCLAMYCNSCHCYGARTRVAIEKKGYISEREIKASTNAESMAVDTWNRRIEKMKPCKKCAHEKICRYCGIETSGCPHYLAAENNWIPFGFDEDGMLTGRLPEEDEEILVINKYGYIHKDEWCVDANGEYYLDSGWILVDYATAWMPLPEPYKPENNPERRNTPMTKENMIPECMLKDACLDVNQLQCADNQRIKLRYVDNELSADKPKTYGK